MFQQYGFKYYIVYCIVAIVASKFYFIEKLLTYHLQNPLRYLGVIGIFHRCVSSVFITYVGILRIVLFYPGVICIICVLLYALQRDIYLIWSKFRHVVKRNFCYHTSVMYIQSNKYYAILYFTGIIYNFIKVFCSIPNYILDILYTVKGYKYSN